VPRVVAAYVTCALIWGTTWYAIRVSIAPGGYPTLVALALRFVIATLLLAPLAVRVRPWPRGKAWWYLIAAGVLDAAAYLLVYLGEERVSGGIAAVVYGTQPLILGLLLSVVRIETITRRHLAGAVVSLGGVAVLFLDRLDVSAAQAVGVALVFGSVVLSTCYSAIMKRHGGNTPPLVTTAIFLGVTAGVLGVTALVSRQSVPWPPPVDASLALLYLAVIGSALAFLVYFWLLGKTSLLVTSTLVFVFPLVALATDAVLDAAGSLTPRAYLGAGITLAGLAVSLRRG
jgi:drug/metabolite transporter (DMT)-like permease